MPGSDGRLSVVSSNGSKRQGSDDVARLDLFGNRVVAGAFEQLRSDADVIVVNAPAVADAAELVAFARAADRIVIAVELGLTSQARLDELVQTLNEERAEITGFVLFARGRGRGTGGRLSYGRTIAPHTEARRAAPRQRRRKRPAVENKPQSLETNS